MTAKRHTLVGRLALTPYRPGELNPDIEQPGP